MPKTKTGASGAAPSPAASALPPSAAPILARWGDGTTEYQGRVAHHARASGAENPARFVAERFAAFLAPIPAPAWIGTPAPTLPNVPPYALAGPGEEAGDDFAALFAMLATPEAGALLDAVAFFPDDAYRAPRLGFTPPDLYPASGTEADRAAWKTRRDKGPTVEHTCGLTGASFGLPFGCPVPALFITSETPAGKTYTDAHTLHPEVHAAGPEAVARAIWRRAENAVASAAEHLADALHKIADARVVLAGVAMDGPGETLKTEAGELRYYTA